MTTRKYIKDILNDLTKELAFLLCDELREIIKKEKYEAGKLRKMRRRRLLKPYNRYEALVKDLKLMETVNYRNRLPDEKFEEILNIVSCKIQKQDTLMREALPARVKLKIVLHYLTTGDNFQTLSELYKIPKNSISQFLPTVCKAIFEGLQEHIQIPRSKKDWKTIQNAFESKWNFATCCGAIDGCLIPVRCAKDLPQNSISLIGIVDDEYKFIHITIQRHDDIREDLDFSKTSFSKILQYSYIPEEGVFVANSSFSLTQKILTPYDSEKLTPSQDVYNYRLERVSRLAENALGLLQLKFRVFERPCSLKIETIELALKALCVLHNWLIKTTAYLSSEDVDFEDISSGTIIPGEWRQRTTNKKINFIKYENCPSAIYKRHTYASRFVVKDILPWQWKMARVDPITFS